MNNPDYINKIVTKLKAKNKHIKVVDFSKECPIANPYPISRLAKKPSDYYKLQIDDLTTKYFDLLNAKQCSDERYKQILKELDYLYKLIESKCSCVINTSSECSIPMCPPIEQIVNNNSNNQNILKYEDPGDNTFVITDPNVSFAVVSMTGGGGAGGIGYVDGQYYYGGGGGGGASSIVYKPVKVTLNTVITSYVGQGGSQLTQADGESSYVEFKYPDGSIVRYITQGGLGASPYIKNINTLTRTRSMNRDISRNINIIKDEVELQVNGGTPGKTSVWGGIEGQPGVDGIITVPSQIPAIGSPGGASMFGLGGLGGMNKYDEIIGQNGTYGSGGGGSAPQLVFDDQTVSGNGGNGVVLIQFM